MSIVIVGAGGHARVIIEMLRAAQQEIVCCVAEEGSPAFCGNVPVHIGDEKLKQLRDDGANKIFIAIGDNKKRQSLAEIAIKLNYTLVNAISPHAYISPSAKLGNGIAVMPGSVVNADARIDDLAIINTGAIVDHDCHIGNAAHIAPQVAVSGNVKVGKGALLGVGCKVVPNVAIGDWTVVAAGGVVVRDLPKGVVAKGIPARFE